VCELDKKMDGKGEKTTFKERKKGEGGSERKTELEKGRQKQALWKRNSEITLDKWI
jgi:hypothetical protein